MSWRRNMRHLISWLTNYGRILPGPLTPILFRSRLIVRNAMSVWDGVATFRSFHVRPPTWPPCLNFCGVIYWLCGMCSVKMVVSPMWPPWGLVLARHCGEVQALPWHGRVTCNMAIAICWMNITLLCMIIWSICCVILVLIQAFLRKTSEMCGGVLVIG